MALRFTRGQGHGRNNDQGAVEAAGRRRQRRHGGWHRDRPSQLSYAGRDIRRNNNVTIEAPSHVFSHRAHLSVFLRWAARDTPTHRGQRVVDGATVWFMVCCTASLHNCPRVHAACWVAPRPLQDTVKGNGTATGGLCAASLCDPADGLLWAYDAARSALGATPYTILSAE